MSLEPGRRLGPFEVVELLGQGGMGEVYRARDTRLHRDVALKVLSDRYARDEQRIARFRREAVALAAFAHPHIATLFGIEEAGNETTLVMELVDGEMLDDRIARYRDSSRGRGLPVDEALRLAGEIADALERCDTDRRRHRELVSGASSSVAESMIVQRLRTHTLRECTDVTSSHRPLAPHSWLQTATARGRSRKTPVPKPQKCICGANTRSVLARSQLASPISCGMRPFRRSTGSATRRSAFSR
jgi:serine/threonine protein kinase